MTRRLAPPYREIELIVGGKRIRDDRATLDIFNPATGEIIGACPCATIGELNGPRASKVF